MALRTIRGPGDKALFLVAKKVDGINAGTIRLLDDLAETMRDKDGIGLAAPQLGIAKRIFVVEFEDQFYEMINPYLISYEGDLIDIEGCLSYPGIWAEVSRPEVITLSAMNREGEDFIVTAEGVLARALMHELDHLDGNVFIDKVIRFLDPSELIDEVEEGASIRAVIEYRRGERNEVSE